MSNKYSQYILPNIYIILWLLYGFHWADIGFLFPFLEQLSNIFLGINLLISIYYTYQYFYDGNNNQLLRVVMILLCVFAFGQMLSMVNPDPLILKSSGKKMNIYTYFVSVLRSFLPIFTFYVFTKKGLISIRLLQFYFFVFLIHLLLMYSASRIMLGLLEDEDIITNNIAYLFVCLIPYAIFFPHKSLLQYVILGILMFFIVVCVKRGAILSGTLMILYFFKQKIRNASKFKKVLVFISIPLFVYFLSDILIERLSGSSTVAHRIESTIEGKTSGRDRIYSFFLNKYASDFSFAQQVFGYGGDGTIRLGPKQAHNDWIELLINQGLIGVIVYFIFWIQFFLIWRRTKRDVGLHTLLGLLFIALFSKSLYSMQYAMIHVYTSMLMGYCFYKYDRCFHIKFLHPKKCI